MPSHENSVLGPDRCDTDGFVLAGGGGPGLRRRRGVWCASGGREHSRIVAVDRSGGNLKLLSATSNEYSRGFQINGGEVLDWLPDQDGVILMSRVYLPDEHTSSHLSTREGLGVDLLDTRTLSKKNIEDPTLNAVSYLSDGRGTVRIVGRYLRAGPGIQDTGMIRFEYRRRGSREWLKSSDFDAVNGAGFEPLAVDPDLDAVFGQKKKDGRWAIYKVSLDGSLTENLVYARPDADVTGLFRIGRRNRVVGLTYATDSARTVYLDSGIERLMRSLSRALPKQPNLRLIDSSVDEQVFLILAGSDDDPGIYYVYDRPTKQLRIFMGIRDELEGVKLATVKPINYPAADGVMIPGYLTLPPGKDSNKGLPAIVLPHAGPSARDYWGFDWLSQYFAYRGFAVLRPNFRGSAGYGDAWMIGNGFQSWRTAIGDVLDAGRWLVSQEIADPAKLAVVGWSYGGYAALQSAVVDPGLFKAVVAIAPVTDLPALKEEWRDWSNFRLVSQYIGDGADARAGSPANNADKIKVPVLLFHGGLDRNVAIRQSRLMAERLGKAGVKNELITWDDLDHQLEDSDARAQMLRKSDQFLLQVMGLDQ